MLKRMISLIIAVGLVLGLVGCGGAPEPAKPAAPAKPAEPQEYRIAVIAPLTGPMASSAGKQAQEGINLAVKLINEKGGVSGKKLVVDYLDDRAQASEATVMAQKVADDKKYAAVIAHFSSDACFAAMPIYEKAGIPMLTAWASHAELTTRSKISFRMSPSTLFYGRLNGEAITDVVKKGDVAIILANAEYHKDHTKNLKAWLEEKKVKVVKEELYMVGDSDFKPQLTNIIKAKPGVLAIVGYPKETGLIVNQARQMGYKGPITVAPGGAAPELYDIAAKSLTDTYMGGGGAQFREALAGKEVKNAEIKTYVEKYRAEYKKDPAGGWDAQAYDLIRVLAQVYAKAGNDRAKVLAELNALKDFQGVNGMMFGPDRAMVPEFAFSKFDQKANMFMPITK